MKFRRSAGPLLMRERCSGENSTARNLPTSSAGERFGTPLSDALRRPFWMVSSASCSRSSL